MSERTCSVDGCERPLRARGFCNAHWKRWRWNGDPLAGKPRTLVWARLLRSFDTIEGGCWEWRRGLNNMGYGRVTSQGKSRSAHRVAYELIVGPIPEGLELDHLCRNPACVNPAHLEPVTHRENLRRSPLITRKVTHCKHGHEFTPENTRETRTKGGRLRRDCLACDRERNRRRNRRRQVLGA